MCSILKVFILISLLHTQLVTALLIGAFNVKVFGKAKASRNDVMDIIIKIIQRYDISFIQEIKDISDFTIKTLMTKLNKRQNVYSFAISERLGRSDSKEQYAFIYRNDAGLTLETIYQHEDVGDIFEREPYAVHFCSQNTVIRKLTLIGVHITPRNVTVEMNRLDDIRDHLVKEWRTDNVIMLGDMNTGCNFISKKRIKELDLWKDGSHWLIPNDADTTLAKSHCAYDRFIVSGNNILHGIAPNSTKVYRFDIDLGLTEEQAKSVSDHYPIEMRLKDLTSGQCSLIYSSFAYFIYICLAALFLYVLC